ncbi:MAG: PP2C family protein-serine/threonine phosphatase, partial [Oscillospiraceae bacterium]|nr:PP2C family protein-serine/threonine phosphatase [Oscillospiraceae bacterium]
KCEKNTFCWIEHYNETADVLNQADQAQRRTGYVRADGLPRFFQYRCAHLAEVCGALAKSRALELTAVAAEAKTDLLRSALNDQYSAVADSLEQLADQVLREERLDAARTHKVTALFREMELQPLEAAVTRDTAGRFQVRVRTPRVVLTQEEERALEEEVSHCCSRVLRLSACEGQGSATLFIFLEQALLRPVYAQSGSAAKEGVSADVAEYFCDENGRAHILLCDGMGTGRSAAIDGKMAALLTRKLLLAGFGCDAAARLVNVALQLKGREEGGAALDAFSVDLYTGKGVLFKAGAAPTFILHEQQVEVLASDSLPVGTASGAEGILTETQLAPGDIVVLVSDGVLTAGESRVKEKLARLAQCPAEKIAQELAAFAKNQSVRADDITVAVLCLGEPD